MDEAIRRIEDARENNHSELDLSYLSLREVPEALASISSLTWVNLGYNLLEQLPSWFSNFPDLKGVDLSSNGFKEIPAVLKQLPSLYSLDFGGNAIELLPAWLSEMDQLSMLGIAENPITNAHILIPTASRLSRLEVNDHDFITLADILDKERLSSLGLYIQEADAPPSALYSMSLLTGLRLWGSCKRLDERIQELADLKQLSLNCKLDIVPEAIGQLTQLQTLDVSGNQLTALPEAIGQLTQLQTLDVSGNQLTALPATIGQLTQLQTLYVSGNRLTALPATIGQLTQLQTLDVSGNQLTALPEAIGQLTQLQTLYVLGNRLTALPATIGQLTQLESLDVSRNQLTALPATIGQLTQLQKLDVSENQLTALPEAIGQLTQLQKLYVARNQLTALPENMGLLVSLLELDLAKNRLKDLPESIRVLPLRELWLQSNPALGLSTAVLGKYPESGARPILWPGTNPPAILEAFFSTRSLEGKPLDEVKLVLVGRGEAGKTSIAYRLVKGKFKRVVKETPGVNISTWPLQCEDRVVDVNIWDFAGQVVTHSTHQFFLTESSVYLLVLTGRGDTYKIDAEYWLRLIRAFATDIEGNTSPVIVALNKFDENAFKVDRNALREKYPFIEAFIETDCKSARGFEDLKGKLVQIIQKMPIVQERFKLSWWQIKHKLEKIQKRKNHIPYSSFQDICTEFGETDPDRQRFLAGVFHVLGVALNYGSDERLRNATVLNPRWVTDSIYKLLREGARDDGSAIMTMQRVAELLPKEPPDMQAYLVDLMRRFDLAFPLNEKGDQWLVPQRLPAEQPDLGNEWQELTDATRLRFTYPIIPEGLLPRFITRTYPLSEGDEGKPALPRWANGVVLQNREAFALVRVDTEERQINVVVKGPREDGLFLLGVIQSDFRTLHGQITGLDVSEDLEVEGHPSVYVTVQGLIADELDGKDSSATTRSGTITFKPTPELDRLSEQPARREEWRPRVFISYSSTDARLKDILLVRLKPMKEIRGLVEVWHDRCITPGEDWDGVIRKELQAADVILFLISPGFFASDYINGVEVEEAVRRAAADGDKVKSGVRRS
ncbi:MAG: leucine-rich repeat domain-containing protein [Thiobacillaceae bacterium]